jgi:prepilin-type N-terminal cleavage/methylation domain-containing protein
MRASKTAERGFTLAEMLAVVGISATLATETQNS